MQNKERSAIHKEAQQPNRFYRHLSGITSVSALYFNRVFYSQPGRFIRATDQTSWELMGTGWESGGGLFSLLFRLCCPHAPVCRENFSAFCQRLDWKRCETTSMMSQTCHDAPHRVP